MAKFLFWSDLHAEFTPFPIPLPAEAAGAPSDAVSRDEVDAILIAGDAGTDMKHLEIFEQAWDIWRRPVLAVDGNHEGYGQKRLQKLWSKEDEALARLHDSGADIHLLRGAQRTVGDTRVIGATFWTDQAMFPGYEVGVGLALKQHMNDYDAISFYDERRGIYRKLIPQDTKMMHSREKAAIYGMLSEPVDGRTVVMTHHLPVMEMLHPDRRGRQDLVSAGYASNLAHEICRFRLDAWVCGHSHDSVEFLLPGYEGDIRFMRNIRGYAHKNERTDFNPYRLLDSNAPRLVRELEKTDAEADGPGEGP